MNKDKYFVLFQDCQIVKGAKRTLLFDLFRNKVIDITSFEDRFIKNRYLKVSNDTSELISFLITERLGSYAEEIKNLLSKPIVWKSPRKINEIVIEHKCNDEFNLSRTYEVIEKLSVEFIQIRFVEFDISKLTYILSLPQFGLRTFKK